MTDMISEIRVIKSLSEIDKDDWNTVAAVGNFDGVHLGHQKIIEQAKMLAKRLGTVPSILTFEPHPRVLFQTDGIPFRLSTSASKALALSTLGIELIFELQFDKSFAQLSAEDFVVRVLKENLRLQHVVCGYDFVFGHRRRGTAEILENLAMQVDIGVTIIPAVAEKDGAVYSSTRVRQCLAEGDPVGASELLGRPWSFSALVEAGDQRGRTIGFPTCNLRVIDLVQPCHGVYAVFVQIENERKWLPGVANFGRRPTVNDRGALFEVNLFDIERDLYNKRLTVCIMEFIRPELKFEGLDDLKSQIAADAKSARDILANCKVPRF
ncbi:MAG: bifunctional riboflavin kinase/FAD synthetase [Nisaea sp.]|jgi:riboflavin kinase/FMN adenylyltransferase|nr:bifunctional riboflavin kinase/FAD synthetase [Nisaea sp.]MEC7972120.1 bifunctional riboflavin kinase/FAD synthetase [Pseudomonadota bacterium]MEC9100520.1 bifunctional riboflavin kinase/FAD synthetase [Pseudomonadota bacterium]|tara:strand:- start:3963 stop:4934 length:972 start_codon:yes stop_codon:yes gene_type:complete